MSGKTGFLTSSRESPRKRAIRISTSGISSDCVPQSSFHHSGKIAFRTKSLLNPPWFKRRSKLLKVCLLSALLLFSFLPSFDYLMNRRKHLVCQVQSNALCCGGYRGGFSGIMSCMLDYNLLLPDIRKGQGGRVRDGHVKFKTVLDLPYNL